MRRIIVFLFVVWGCSSGAVAAWLALPTENRALFEGVPEDFYMFVERDFEGQKSRPWQGGMYGFTRSPRRIGGQVVATRFHEGIDISPVRRNASGEPLDPVLAAADGVVVHVSADAGGSNYGRYIVVKHQWQGVPYYTLYSHLGKIHATVGQQVRQGDPLAILGYTGSGIDRERAHLHFEVCLLINPDFDGWFAQYLPAETNRHGVYNGMNLLGMDPAKLLLAVRDNPRLTLPEFLAGMRPLFRVTVPHSRHFAWLRDYPWLLEPGTPAAAPAWAVTFSDHFIPLRIEARSRATWPPQVEWLGAESSIPLSIQSGGRIEGTAKQPRLTESGLRFAHLLTFPDRAGKPTEP